MKKIALKKNYHQTQKHKKDQSEYTGCLITYALQTWQPPNNCGKLISGGFVSSRVFGEDKEECMEIIIIFK